MNREEGSITAYDDRPKYCLKCNYSFDSGNNNWVIPRYHNPFWAHERPRCECLVWKCQRCEYTWFSKCADTGRGDERKET